MGTQCCDWLVGGDGDTSETRVVHPHTRQLVLVPESALGTLNWEYVPLVRATSRLAHVELLAVVRVNREGGDRLSQQALSGAG